MSSVRLPRRSFAWIALVALLFNALAPLVMQCMTQDAGYSELCTARGIERIADNGDGSDPGMTVSGAHCPLCLAPHSPFVPTRPVVTELHAPSSQFAWAPAQPRAPPCIA
jgi:hypothetical protein